MHVAARRGFDYLVVTAAQRRRRRTLVTRSLVHPLEPMVPPRALVLGCGLQPSVGIGPSVMIGKILRFEIGRRTHHALYVAAPAHHEFGAPAEQTRRAMACTPRAYMVGLHG